MDLLIGINNTKIKTHFLQDTLCYNCNTRGSFMIETRRYYFSIFFIPIIPLHIKRVAICAHCGTKTEYEYWSAEIKNKYHQINSIDPPKNPLWLYSGCLGVLAIVFIVLLTIIVGVFIGVKDEISSDNSDQIHPTETSIQLEENDTVLSAEDSVVYDFEKKIDTFKGVSNRLREEEVPKDSINSFFIK